MAKEVERCGLTAIICRTDVVWRVLLQMSSWRKGHDVTGGWVHDEAAADWVTRSTMPLEFLPLPVLLPRGQGSLGTGRG